jgi:predicted RecB family nuclease
MSVTQEIFEAFVNCPTKSHLYSDGAMGTQSEFHEWRRRVQEEYKEAASARLHSPIQTNECYIGTPPVEHLEQRRYRLIFDYVVTTPELRARLHGLELARSGIGRADRSYIPIRFVPREKLATSDKLLLAFDAFALSQVFGKAPRTGKIVHGRQYSTVTVALVGLLDRVQSVLNKMATQLATTPSLILNRHCAECEFQSRCRQIAVEKDDLSLLATISDKECKKQNDKGIFTVTQLSYTFRSRRHSTPLVKKHFHALKALAIRKNKIHILGAPDLNASGTPVYFDVEGDPDRDFYYLIGMRTAAAGSTLHYSFWADDAASEGSVWADCLDKLSEIEKPRLIHYGSYETKFLKRMRAKYPSIGNPAFLDELASSALNLLSIIYAHIYFPTYTNSLKEIAKYLGCRWSQNGASGLNAHIWRSKWDISREPYLKQMLLAYNAEDCEATQKVAEALSAACQAVFSGKPTTTDVVNANSLKREYPQRFGKTEFLLSQFQKINEAAYWDYQRNRVYVRSDRRLLRLSHKAQKRHTRSSLRPNKIISVEEQRPASCTHCNGSLIYKWGRYSQTVYDLRLSPGGIKRWVVRYSFSRYICWNCKATFHLYVRKPRYGAGLCAYLLYQIIDVPITQNAAAKSVRQLFGLPLSRGLINHVKSIEASRYQAAYSMILDRISAGRLVHSDETKVTVGGKNGYVWVFTNLENVAFVYSETREGSTLQSVLRNFQGVLVSDFYAAYDSIECAQQKCLIHLMRDVNDDLCKETFNEEMKGIAEQFAGLVQPMIETVDRFGLKAHYLRKHKRSVDQFYEALSKQNFQTEVAAAYKKRFEKNKNKLFTFLDHDGVPWNNNNAEHAIKALVRLRNGIGGKSSTSGMRDYLVLLSISQTCSYKGVSFLDFLRSGQRDVNALTNRSCTAG